MKRPFAFRTAKRLTCQLDDSTPLERALVRQRYLNDPARPPYQILGFSRLQAYRLSDRMPTSELVMLRVERLDRFCRDCTFRVRDPYGRWEVVYKDLPWAAVGGHFDGGPECPDCSAPYWKEWHWTLHEIASLAVAQCRAEAEAISAETVGCSVEAILDTCWMKWNPAPVYPRSKIDRRFEK